MKKAPLLATSEVIDIIREYIPEGRIWMKPWQGGFSVCIETHVDGKSYRYEKHLTRVEIDQSTRAFQETWIRMMAKTAAEVFQMIGEQHDTK